MTQICPLVGADIEVNEFSREIALRQPEYYGVLGILDSSTNVLVSSIVRRMTTSLGRAPTSSQRLTYDAMLVYADSAVRTVQAGQMPSNRTAFITAINQADFLGSTGFFEFGAISRDGDLAVLNFALLHGASSVTVETRDYAGWSRREGLHQEQDQQYSELVFFDGSSDVPSDGFARTFIFEDHIQIANQLNQLTLIAALFRNRRVWNCCPSVEISRVQTMGRCSSSR